VIVEPPVEQGEINETGKIKKTHVSVPAIAKQKVTLLCKLRNATNNFTETMKKEGWKEFDRQRPADQVKDDGQRGSFIVLPEVEEGKTILEGAEGTYSCTYGDETIFFYVFIIPTIKEPNTDKAYDNRKHVEKELNDLRSELSKFLVENDALVGEKLRGLKFNDKTKIDTVEKGKQFQNDQKKLLQTMEELKADIEAKQKNLNPKIIQLEELIQEDLKYWRKGEISNADKEELQREIREPLQSEIEILKEKEASLKYTQDALAVSIGLWGGIFLIFWLYQLRESFCPCNKKSDEFDLEDGSNSGTELAEA